MDRAEPVRHTLTRAVGVAALAVVLVVFAGAGLFGGVFFLATEVIGPAVDGYCAANNGCSDMGR